MSPNDSDTFYNKSYQHQQSHLDEHLTDAQKKQLAQSWMREDTVDAWRHRRMYQAADPLLHIYPSSEWLTVGDGRYGSGAHYIHQKEGHVTASDISIALLRQAVELNYIPCYEQANAEQLPFSDSSYDFVLCKEAYHHFPRPTIALHEMLRVARKAVILIEPADEHVHESIRQILFSYFKSFLKLLLRKKNDRNAYETVGNYIYTISKREIEKVSLGMNLPHIAFKSINDYYIKGAEQEQYDIQGPILKKIQRKITLKDILVQLGLQKPSLISAILFKESVSVELRRELQINNYTVIDLPCNPYLS